MNLRFWSRGSRLLPLAVATLMAVAARPIVVAAAESETASAVTAAFVYNFAKFAAWPADALAPGQKLSLCVIGSSAVSEALERTIRGNSIEGHELTVQVIKLDSPTPPCHLLYVAAAEIKRSASFLAALKGTPVFTVSDAEKFAESGGIAQLIVENDRMRFAINVTAAQHARITLSSKLLSLAKIVP